MEKIFDFHFHFLFKHHVSDSVSLDNNVTTEGLAKLLDAVFGGPFASQSSPKQVKNSQLYLGVVALLSIEHAYANRIMQILGLDFSKGLPINKQIISDTKNGKTSYFKEFNNQIDFYVNHEKKLKDEYNIVFLQRKDWTDKTIEDIKNGLTSNGKRYLSFSIEGGHNLSNVPIRSGILSKNPELQLKELQDSSKLDFISINLAHLSDIPEQSLTGFAQGVNKMSQIAFHSEDFMPRTGIGLTELGKKVITQAHTHPSKSLLIDVKHMSVYSRFHYYRYKEQLTQEYPDIARLPIISSHSGFTFTNLVEYQKNKQFRSSIQTKDGKKISIVDPENRKIGRTNDLINRGLYSNPWSINLFDEDIVEIMESRGLIGIILDQRVLGGSNPVADSSRSKYYEGEHISYPEWERLFRDGTLPGAERFEEKLLDIFPSRPERHIMLFAMHIIYAVKLGYQYLEWLDGSSPWQTICIGSDYDGLINPINGFENIEKLSNLKSQLRKYLPQADKYLLGQEPKALKYNDDGTVNTVFLDKVLDDFLYNNGVHFMARFLSNWKN